MKHNLMNGKITDNNLNYLFKKKFELKEKNYSYKNNKI